MSEILDKLEDEEDDISGEDLGSDKEYTPSKKQRITTSDSEDDEFNQNKGKKFLKRKKTKQVMKKKVC